MGMDLSFTRAGITIIDLEEKKVYNHAIKGNMGRSFNVVYKEGVSRCRTLNDIMKMYPKINTCISEAPFAGGITSCGLFLLDSLIFYTLQLSGVKTLYTSHPSHLKHIHGKAYEKSDSVKLANELRVILQKNGYTLNKNKITHDEAESTIYACRLLVLLNADSKLTSEIIKHNKRFADKKEELLYTKN